ncbi:VOC family protein [Mycobacterium asiaticum]|uniref:Glyoxalase n=1 Tax=Mycobacterium asiaticum TaxID=1790 RepID=A0A1A3KKZ1_MYCAS|nr:VOC family protein [Mycobacterium asiaticum]OBI85933.1 glyoxalase [Mycobacterium asiaticum]OBJ85043.1 glyoxalase [Mycobacterium asiaticum]ORA17067.1 glyoxalase/bleomycin resistance/dioxygenase family protein [Mycobacterium asiaticum DSM 44297]
MNTPRRITEWPERLASIGAIRFARRSANYAETVRFYRELVGLPLYETFGESYGSNGAIFGLPSSQLTMEIVESVDPVPLDHHDQLCLYFPDSQAQQAAIARLRDAGLQPAAQHPYWEATGAVTYRDPDGREVVFAPFVYGANEPPDSSASGRHEFPSN